MRVNQVDLVLTMALNSKFSIGVDGTLFSAQAREADRDFGPAKNWWGSAVYFNYDPLSWLGVTLRSEYFDDSEQLNVFGPAATGGNIFANTLSFNIKKDNLIVVPELRFEKASEAIFTESPDAATDTAMSVLLAAIYKF